MDPARRAHRDTGNRAAAGIGLYYTRGVQELARGWYRDALAAFMAAERLAGLLEAPDLVVPRARALQALALERHSRHRTAHAALVAEIRGLLAGPGPREPRGIVPPKLADPLSGSELRVLRYLPTNLTAPEIARELSVSTNTVKTHIRNLYAKLGTHRRAETVTQARDMGLLAPSAHSAR